MPLVSTNSEGTPCPPVSHRFCLLFPLLPLIYTSPIFSLLPLFLLHNITASSQHHHRLATPTFSLLPLFLLHNITASSQHHHRLASMQPSESTEALLQESGSDCSQSNRKVLARSSLDTFLIPGRTRLPSSKSTVPDHIGLGLTRKIMSSTSLCVPGRTSSQNFMASGPEASRLNQRSSSGTDTSPRNGLDGQLDSTDQSRATSTTWSTISRRIFTSSSGSSDHRETKTFVKEYNSLAMKHGLPQFVADNNVQIPGKPRWPSTIVNILTLTQLSPIQAFRKLRKSRSLSMAGSFASFFVRVLHLITSRPRQPSRLRRCIAYPTCLLAVLLYFERIF